MSDLEIARISSQRRTLSGGEKSLAALIKRAHGPAPEEVSFQILVFLRKYVTKTNWELKKATIDTLKY
jgi:hypothetical protein